jgi:hypothetical protein
MSARMGQPYFKTGAPPRANLERVSGRKLFGKTQGLEQTKKWPEDPSGVPAIFGIFSVSDQLLGILIAIVNIHRRITIVSATLFQLCLA